MTTRDELARRAVTEALRLRTRHGRAVTEPVCPIDLALEAGVDVRLEAIKSLEGMYTPDGPLIMLGTLRPPGRRSYTCAHELGHHVFGHGLRIDQMAEGTLQVARRSDDEFVADRFAAALLLPKLAVLNAFAVRHWQISNCTPLQAFTIAGLFGVGYTTLLGYLEKTLRKLSHTHAVTLRAASPKAIRTKATGRESLGSLVVVDEFWSGRPVDCEVGDFLLFPCGAQVNGTAVAQGEDAIAVACRPGRDQITSGPWSVDVRVARASYTGLACYRHLEDADDRD